MGAESLKTLCWKVPLPQPEKTVFCFLGSFADKTTALTYPSKATLMHRCQLDEDALRIALQSLKQRGLISWERREKSSNVYTIHVDEVKRHMTEPVKG